MTQRDNKRDNIYQSILINLGGIPTSYLQEIDIFLRNITTEIRQKEQNRVAILNLAEGWSDMTETDFNDYLQVVKESRSDMFNREIEL
ncbi:MAG: hypothetical protein GW809_04135 [Bacteroidetes bacterium]|nr:hypothetical protein [Bacteroidota bacterium]NCQ11335.1 hypothetical protein [Bacteroidota bacterium]